MVAILSGTQYWKWKRWIRIYLAMKMADMGILTHHGPVPHICAAIFSAYFPSAPDMWRWFQCSFPQCPIHGALQTARSSPVPQIVVARPHILFRQRPIYVARHGPLSLHVLYGNIKCFHQNIGRSSRLPSSINCSCWNNGIIYTICCNLAPFIVNYQTLL